jgi:hypothetical protein
MPSYADFNHHMESPVTVKASLSTGYFATEGHGTPSSRAEMPHVSGSPVTSSITAGYYATDGQAANLLSSTKTPVKGAWKTAKMSPSKTSKAVPVGRLASSTAKYAKLVSETGVVISALPAKLQPMFSRFDVSGGE